MNFILFLYIIIYSVLYDQPNHAPSTTPLAACFYSQPWLVPYAFCNVCMLRNGREKDSPNLKNVGFSGVVATMVWAASECCCVVGCWCDVMCR